MPTSFFHEIVDAVGNRTHRHGMVKPIFAIIFAIILVVGYFFVADTDDDAVFRVGVSQCSTTEWRTKMNNEMLRQAKFLGNMELTFRSARDNSEVQNAQVDSFIREGIDLLIIAPNQKEELDAAIERAKSAGIKVVVVDRHCSTNAYDAFVGPDNYLIGTLAGAYIARQMHGKGKILEVYGLRGSSAAEDRHRGFADVIKEYPEIKIIAQAEGKWFAPEAKRAVEHLPYTLEEPDLVYSHNDRMIPGVQEALADRGFTPVYVGTDGVPGEGNGLDMVSRGLIKATVINPSGGDKIVLVADSLLKGYTTQRTTILTTGVVDSVNVILTANAEKLVESREAAIEHLNQQAERQRQIARQQKRAVVAGGVIVVILVLVILLMAFFNRSQRAIYHELREQANRLARQKETLDEQRKQMILLNARDEIAPDPPFAEQVKAVIEAHLADPALDVDALADALHMSRSMLFRRMKEACISSPAALIRYTRLTRAEEMLTETDHTIAQVAKATGFTSETAFSRAYNEFFGVSPRKRYRNAL